MGGNGEEMGKAGTARDVGCGGFLRDAVEENGTKLGENGREIGRSTFGVHTEVLSKAIPIERAARAAAVPRRMPGPRTRGADHAILRPRVRGDGHGNGAVGGDVHLRHRGRVQQPSPPQHGAQAVLQSVHVACLRRADVPGGAAGTETGTEVRSAIMH